MKNIILIGMPGSGKSTIGVILAKELGYDFLDTDILICKRENTTLQDIIDTKGVQTLLKVEGEIGETLIAEKTVIATGGSMVFSQRAMKNLTQNGICVYLDVPLDEIKKRVTNMDTRGIAMNKGETLESLYKKRVPKYLEFADMVINVEKNDTIEDVVGQIIKKKECFMID